MKGNKHHDDYQNPSYLCALIFPTKQQVCLILNHLKIIFLFTCVY